MSSGYERYMNKVIIIIIIIIIIITRSCDCILNKVPVVHRFISDHSFVYCTLLSDRPSVTTVPWYNDEIKAAKRLRRKVERTWRSTRPLSDLNIFKFYRNRVTYLMNQARWAFYTNFIDENTTEHKMLFRDTNQLLANK